MKEKRKIMYGSDKAAMIVHNISGWVDSHGRFWGQDEHGARRAGCTHTSCQECGSAIRKNHIRCDDCAEKAAAEKYSKMETRVWDEESPIYSMAKGYYFSTIESVTDHLEREPGTTLESLRLMMCKRTYLECVPEYFWEDALPEETYEIPDELAEALGDFNNFISQMESISWEPTQYAVDCRALSARLPDSSIFDASYKVS